MTTRLAARIEATNKANDYANRLHTLLSPLVRQWVGQDILKQDGTLRAKYEKQLPEFPAVPGVRAWVRVSSYAFAIGVSANVNADDCTMYAEANCHLANLKNGVVGEVSTALELRTDYNAEEVEKLRAAYKVASEAEQAARHALSPFGEYDR